MDNNSSIVLSSGIGCVIAMYVLEWRTQVVEGNNELPVPAVAYEAPGINDKDALEKLIGVVRSSSRNSTTKAQIEAEIRDYLLTHYKVPSSKENPTMNDPTIEQAPVEQTEAKSFIDTEKVLDRLDEAIQENAAQTIATEIKSRNQNGTLTSSRKTSGRPRK